MNIETWSQIIPFIISLIGSITGIWALILQRRKTNAETAAVIEKASGELIGRYKIRLDEVEVESEAQRQEIDLLRQEVDGLKDELRARDDQIECQNGYIEHLLRGIRRLLAQIKSHDLNPVWEPRPRSEFEKCTSD